MLVRVLGAGVKVPLEDPDVPVCQTAQSSKTLEQIQTAEIAAIPAQSFALLLTVPLLLVMEKMSKAELVLHLRTYGEEPPKAWTKLELRQRLNDLAEQGEITIETGKKAKTPLQAAVTELNQASHKKSDLVKFVERRLEMVVTPNRPWQPFRSGSSSPPKPPEKTPWVSASLPVGPMPMWPRRRSTT